MKIVKEHGQWVTHTEGFNPTSAPSRLPFDDDKEEKADDVSHFSSHLHNISGSSVFHPSTDSFTFIEDHCNLLNGRIDSLTSNIEVLGRLLQQLQAQ